MPARIGDPLAVVRSSEHLPIEKYLFLREVQRLDPKTFYYLLVLYMEEMLPYLYTPTVGEACQKYHKLPISMYGLLLRADERGKFLEKLRALPNQEEIGIIVVTDGERILGLGDLGSCGMGISEGKSLLYVAAAGVPPVSVLPVCIDVGTNNESLLADPKYFGIRKRRLVGSEYDAVMDEFVTALKYWKRHVCLQFEDFANHQAFRLLAKYRTNICCFNDDVQGTACICLAGILSALRTSKKSLKDQRFLFLGAGEAGTGIAELIAIALEVRYGIERKEGRKKCFFMDSKGLVCASRDNLQPHKRRFAWDIPFCKSLYDAVNALQPTALIGVSTSKGAFSRDILKLMARLNESPIIFPLSNPTSKSECTFEEAFDATNGRALFASGSPFPPLERDGKRFTPSQANNAYVFPVIGYSAALTKAREIPDEIFLVTAEALSKAVSNDELSEGRLFPRFSDIRRVSANLIGQIASKMCESGIGILPLDFKKVIGRDAINTADFWTQYAHARMFPGWATSKL